MNDRALRPFLNLTAVIAVTFTYTSALHRRSYPNLEFPRLIAVSQIGPSYSQTAAVTPLRRFGQRSSAREHCPSGCHAGVTGYHVHTY